MSGTQGDLLWRDPAHAVSGLLHVISSNLGGDLVLWARVDNVTARVTTVDVVDPIASAQVMADRLRGSEATAPNSLSARVARSGQPLLVPRLDPNDYPIDAFPEPWPEYLTAHPVHGLIAVPVRLDDDTTGVLLVARRTAAVAYTSADLRFVEAGASRLAGPAGGVAADDVAEGRSLMRLFAAHRRRFRLRELAWGAGLPIVIAAILGTVDGTANHRPGALLLASGCIAAALLAGVRAAALSGVVSTLALWWVLTPPGGSWRIARWDDVLGLALFVATAAGVILLVHRLDAARELERLEHQLSETLLDQSPIPMAVFDRQLRFQRVNQPMARMNGLTAAEHVGFRPGDLSPLAGQLYEHLLARVRDSGEAITDHAVAVSMPEIGLERHWRVGFQPLRDGGSDVVGIGAALTDVTHDIVSGRQADRLLQLSESLTTALDEQQVAECVCSFLIDSFQGRSTVGLRDNDVFVIAAHAGFSDHDAADLIGTRVDLLEDSPTAEAARTNMTVIVRDSADFEQRYPASGEVRSMVRDHASLSMPLRADPAGLAVGVMHIGWAASRPITEAMMTLAGTVSSLVTLALARIAATQAAHQIEFRHALDAMLDEVAIARAVRSGNGDIVDFIIEFVNRHTARGVQRDADALVGRPLSEIYPDWRTSGMFDRFSEVVETGTPYQANRVHYVELTENGNWRQGYWSLHVTKFGDGCIAASRDVTGMVAAEEAARVGVLHAEAERTAIGLLQAAALPTTLPELPGVRIAAVYEPADARQPVGGDWYDIFAVDANRVAVVIADVAGHGHRAAVFMVQVRNVFRAIAIEHDEPGDVLSRANDVTTRLNETDGPFVTCCYAVLDVDTRTLRWAQAGHFSPLIVAADGTTTYLDERPGPPLAVFEGLRYESSSVELRPGDRVVMFTDGLVERRREHLDLGLARLAGLAASHARLAPQDFVETLAASVKERYDDLALVCIDFAGPDS